LYHVPSVSHTYSQSVSRNVFTVAVAGRPRTPNDIHSEKFGRCVELDPRDQPHDRTETTQPHDRAMPLKKPGGLGGLAMPAAMERQGSFQMSATGSFSQDSFTIGRNGISHSPLSPGEATSLRLEELELGRQLGRGANAKVYLATHRPSSKPLALKVLENDLEVSNEGRRLLLNELKVRNSPLALTALAVAGHISSLLV
jgi:hypothetical protein